MPSSAAATSASARSLATVTSDDIPFAVWKRAIIFWSLHDFPGGVYVDDGCAHNDYRVARLEINDMAAAGTWRFGIPLAGYVYQLEKSGWFSFPTVSGGFLPTVRDVSSSGASGLLVIEEPDPLLSGDVMAFSHFGRLVRSAFKRHVGVSDMLLTVPLKFSDVLRREGGRLHRWQLRPSATGTTGRNLQGLDYIFFYFQSCLCKLWDVNYQKFI